MKKTLFLMAAIFFFSSASYAGRWISSYWLWSLNKNNWLDTTVFQYKQSVDICKDGQKYVYSGQSVTSKGTSWDVFSGRMNYSKGDKNLTGGFAHSDEKESALNKSCDRLAFSSTKSGTRDIYIIDFNGHGMKNISGEKDFPSNCHNCGSDWDPAFSLDGKQVFFSRCNTVFYTKDTDTLYKYKSTENPSNCYYNLMASDIKTKKVSPVSLSGISDHANVVNPQAGYESEFLVFSSDARGTLQIYRANYDGSNIKQLTFLPKNALRPRLSHDDRYILFVYEDAYTGGKTHYRVMVMDTNGGNMKEVREGDLFNRPETFWWPAFGDYVVALWHQEYNTYCSDYENVPGCN